MVDEAKGIPTECQGRVLEHTKMLTEHNTELENNKTEHQSFRSIQKELFEITRNIQKQIFDEVVKRPRPEDAATIARLYGLVGALIGVVGGIIIKIWVK